MATGNSLAMLPFFVRDYIAATRHMSLAERGAYTDLLFQSWERGPLPNDPAKLARMVGCGVDEFAPIWAGIMDRFTQTETGLVNQRLEQHRAESHRRSEAARDSANSRWQRARSTGNHATASAGAHAKASPNAHANGHAGAYANGHADSMLPSPSPSPSPDPSPSSDFARQDRELTELVAKIQAVYPRGTKWTDADWLPAQRAIAALLDQGESADALLAGAEQYRAQLSATGGKGPFEFSRKPSRHYAEGHWRGPFLTNADDGAKRRDTQASSAALDAWERLIGAGWPAGRPTAVQRALDAIGGWSRVRERTSEKSPQIRSEFCRAYDQASRSSA